ncbi:TatD family hydrolase [Anaerotalea alkaliphila]|uniref:TatD family hydrolase n=1 Tax=Anaerotalea alkaliphila TaxID=2662126 RepID=A0A7X5HW40_9FIRM|nr:TatD family hydrolase [Anaerotalea alkaliphila]NDL67720.1 TatD family hydrolase [Anaerotalea alkaliphila]
MIFESHAHYDDERFQEDRDQVLSSLGEHNIGYVVNIGASMESTRMSLELARRYDFVYAAVGVHPHEVGDMTEQDLELLREYGRQEKVVAVGEVGLDYYYDTAPREAQRRWFREQTRLAVELGLPVVVHSRDASKETFDILQEEAFGRILGVIHCFSGSRETALEYVKHGFYIGVGGVLTFPNSKALQRVVDAVPLSSILVETDAPYLAPVPNRGRRNDSRNLPHIIEAIARRKGLEPKEVEDATFENARRLFSL